MGSKLVYGVGVNDADYLVTESRFVEGKYAQIWMCPFYQRWKSMLTRSYSAKYKKLWPTYDGVSVCAEWLYFSNFKSWMEQQDWEGKELDKDLLIKGNNLYSPDNCVFVSKALNSFLNERAASRGEYPIGVCFHKMRGKFQATCKLISGKQQYLGLFLTAEEAHEAWGKAKWIQAQEFIAKEPDQRIIDALTLRYKFKE